MDRGAWKATAHGVAESWTQKLKLLSTHLPCQEPSKARPSRCERAGRARPARAKVPSSPAESGKDRAGGCGNYAILDMLAGWDSPGVTWRCVRGGGWLSWVLVLLLSEGTAGVVYVNPCPEVKSDLPAPPGLQGGAPDLQLPLNNAVSSLGLSDLMYCSGDAVCPTQAH